MLAQVPQVAEADLKLASYSPSAPLRQAPSPLVLEGSDVSHTPQWLVHITEASVCFLETDRHREMSDSLPETTLAEKSHGVEGGYAH